MRTADYLPAARSDFDESFDWYAKRSPRAALGFVAAVDQALATIAANPERFAVFDGVHRACPVSRYPFRIVYREVEDRVVVVAVAHAKRRPNYWMDRS